MDDQSGQVLEALLSNLHASYAACAAERRRLHDAEWQAGDASKSVLGEVEIRSVSVSGIATSKEKIVQSDDRIRELERSSMFRSETVVTWLAREGREYPEFVRYMSTVEALRVAAVVFMKQESEVSRNGDDGLPFKAAT